MVSPISWNPNQVRRLKKAIRIYNNAIAKSNIGEFDSLPLPTSFEKEQKLITNRNQLYQRERQLLRITRSDAFSPVVSHGGVIPKYLRNELRNVKRMVNNRRAATLEWLTGGYLDEDVFYDMISNKNLAPIHDEGYTGQDLEDLMDEWEPDVEGRVKLYMALLEDNMGGYDGFADVEFIIEEMAKYEPDILLQLFESNDLEVDIGYIYPAFPLRSNEEGMYGRTFTVDGKTYRYHRNAANQENETDRYANIVHYWRSVANQYLGSHYVLDPEKKPAYHGDVIAKRERKKWKKWTN